MAGFNGSGTYVRNYNWTQDAANAIPILASRFDTEDNGFATGLSSVICRDGQSVISADIPFNSKKITGLGDATAAADALNRQSGDARYKLVKYKSVLTTRNTTPMTADPHLVVALAAGTYSLDMFLAAGNIVTADNTGLKYDFSFSGTVTSSWITHQGFTNTAIALQNSLAYNQTRTITALDPFGASQANYVYATGLIIISVAGNLSLRWGTRTATGTDVGLDAGSWIRMGVLS